MIDYDINLLKSLQSQMADKVVNIVDNSEEGNPLMPFIVVKKEAILEIAKTVRNDDKYSMDYLMNIAGVHIVDKNEQGEIVSKGFEVVYFLYSMKLHKGMVIKTFVEDSDPKLSSVDSVWKSANWFEREVYDLFGVIFENSKDLRRIMLPPDWVGHPLRKDYKEEPMYNGMRTTRKDELKAVRVI